MQYGYLIMREDIVDSDESQWGYPQYCYSYPVLICKHKSIADMKILELCQEDADEFMDWLDIEKENVEQGYCNRIDIDWCPCEWHKYECYKVPYYDSVEVEAPLEGKVFINERKLINNKIKYVIGSEDSESIISSKPMKYQHEEPD